MAVFWTWENIIIRSPFFSNLHFLNTQDYSRAINRITARIDPRTEHKYMFLVITQTDVIKYVTIG